MHNHKVLQGHFIVEDSVIRVSSKLSPPLGQNTASASYGLDWVDCKFWFYINGATDWCYIACNFCQRILRKLDLLTSPYICYWEPPWKKTYKATSHDSFQPPLHDNYRMSLRLHPPRHNKIEYWEKWPKEPIYKVSSSAVAFVLFLLFPFSHTIHHPCCCHITSFAILVDWLVT